MGLGSRWPEIIPALGALVQAVALGERSSLWKVSFDSGSLPLCFSSATSPFLLWGHRRFASGGGFEWDARLHLAASCVAA